MKKMFSLALALIMALALTVPAFAAEDEAPKTTSLTINSAVNDDATYEGYRLLGLTSSLKCADKSHEHDTEDCYNYSYKVNTKYESILKTILGITEAAAGKTMDQTIMDAIAAKTAAADIREFAEDVLDAIENAELAADATMDEGTAKTLQQGYWLIADVTTFDAEDEENGVIRSLVMLDTAGEPALAIDAKDSQLPFEKTVDDIHVYIGQEVTYTLTYTLPAKLAEYEAFTFVITDELSNGLTFTKECEITIGGTEIDAITPAFNGQTMTIDMGEHILANKADYAGKAVVITYTATVNEEAIIVNNGNPNEATLVYTNDPSNGGTGEMSDFETIYTYAIALVKVDVEGKPLAGATFEFPFYVLPKADEDGAYIYAGTTADEEKGLINQIETPEDGTITVKGVEPGTYSITEVVAPDGYNLLADPVTVTAKEIGQITVKDETNTTFYLDENGNWVETKTENGNTATYVNDNFYAESIVVVNKTGVELPSTGGMGTTIFYVVGGVLMVGAAVLLVTKKKLANQE